MGTPAGEPNRKSLSGRGRRAVALIVIAAISVVVVGSVYLRVTSSQPMASSSLRAVDPNLVSANAIDYDFVTPLAGWALLTVYTAGQPDTVRFTVFGTTDGAKHWRRQLTGATSVGNPGPHTIHFVDRSSGFVFVGGSPGDLYRTVDAGGHWLHIESLPAPDVTEVVFADPNHGWLVSGGQTSRDQFVPPAQAPHLFATSDGGASWRTLPEPPPGILFVALRNPIEAWTGSWAFGRPYVYLSLDAGLTWQRRYLPSPPGLNWTAVDSQGVVLMPTSVKVLPGAAAVASVTDFGEQYLFRTTDTGETWNYVPSSPGSITYVDSQHWWAVNEKRLFKSSDAGHTWHVVSDSLPTSLTGLTALDSDHAWAAQIVTGGYGLVVTTDAGLHWHRVPVPNPGLTA
jgi:photosystem II stability/assembly factor-like uncharacterized protein